MINSVIDFWKIEVASGMGSRFRGNDNVCSIHLDVIPAKAGIHARNQHGVWDENITELSSEKHKSDWMKRKPVSTGFVELAT